MQDCVTFAVLSLLPSPLQWGDAGARTWFPTPWNRSPSTQPPPAPLPNHRHLVKASASEPSKWMILSKGRRRWNAPTCYKESLHLTQTANSPGIYLSSFNVRMPTVCKVDAAYLKRPFCSDSSRIPFIHWTWLLLRMWLSAQDPEKSHSTSE